jgi:hypothetical protein
MVLLGGFEVWLAAGVAGGVGIGPLGETLAGPGPGAWVGLMGVVLVASELPLVITVGCSPDELEASELEQPTSVITEINVASSERRVRTFAVSFLLMGASCRTKSPRLSSAAPKRGEIDRTRSMCPEPMPRRQQILSLGSAPAA